MESMKTKGELWITNTAVVFFFLAVTAWLTWPLLPRMASGVSTNPDSLLNHWALAWSFHTLSHDPLSLFDANIFFPRTDTLAYSEHLFGVVVLAAPAYLLSGNAVFAYNFAVAASFLLSGIGMYYLVRELAGSTWAGLFAGVFYMAAPYRFLQFLHIQLLSAQWLPFVFLFLYRYLRDGKLRQLAALLIFILLQVLSCNYYALHLAFALVVFAFLAVGFSLRVPRVLTPKKVGLLLLGAIFVTSLSVPFALPYLRNRSEQGFYRRYEDVVHFSAEPSDYLRPSSFNKALHTQFLPRQHRSEKALFPGLAVMGFAVAGLLARGALSKLRRLMWLFFALLLVSAFILSLGPEMKIGEGIRMLPYKVFYQHVPGFGGLRVPARMAILVLLCLGPLAGWGVAHFGRKAGRFAPHLGCVITLIGLLEYQTYSLDRILPPAPSVPPIYQWLAQQPGDFGVIELPIHEEITNEAIRMYYSTVHWKHLANGFSGWWPNDYWVLVGRMRYFPTARILSFLEREVPVQYVLIHYDQYPARQAERLRQNMERYETRMPIRARMDNDVIYEILPE
jgi:hypothetical protein